MSPAATLSRRALLAVLTGAPAAIQADFAELHTSSGAAPAGDNHFIDCYRRLAEALEHRDQAIAAHDHHERELVFRIGYPRVRLPTGPGKAIAYASSAMDIDCALATSRISFSASRRLARELHERREAWNDAADTCGLTRAVNAETEAAAAVQRATLELFDTPAATLPMLWLKLAVIVATGMPGPVERDSFPWRQLRNALQDLERLMRQPTVP